VHFGSAAADSADVAIDDSWTTVYICCACQFESDSVAHIRHHVDTRHQADCAVHAPWRLVHMCWWCSVRTNNVAVIRAHTARHVQLELQGVGVGVGVGVGGATVPWWRAGTSA
jgi:hypothetical protein